jgi:hypothetical protein
MVFKNRLQKVEHLELREPGREICEKLPMKNFTVQFSPKDIRSAVFKAMKMSWVEYVARIGT